MVPPRDPQFNWIDLGLPSGTLWLDRPLGATSIGDEGLYYQWGALNGYVSDPQYFTQERYSEQGLDLITSELTPSQDAATIYYGGAARIPSQSDVQELIDNVSISVKNGLIRMQSNINGHVISMLPSGYVNDDEVTQPNNFFIWTRNLSTTPEIAAVGRIGLSPAMTFIRRYHGICILPVKSS